MKLLNNGNGTPLEILLVEDNGDDTLMVQEGFSGIKSVHIVVVRDGEEALAYLRKQGKYKNEKLPGLVLLDIRMPKKNGFEVLKEIKSDPELMAVPVVMLTTSSRPEDAIRSYAAGAASYIPKPTGFKEFQEMARQFSIYWKNVVYLPKEKETQ